MVLEYTDLIGIFDSLFANSEQTILVCGDQEPFYRPSQNLLELHKITFAHGYFASALHEIAHWCIAGTKRRLLPDYGYWYQPEGRSSEQQQEFTKVEVKPQALEWIFATAAGSPFHFSADNLADGGIITGSDWVDFQQKVAAQARRYISSGLPPRALRFTRELSQFYRTGDRWCSLELFTVASELNRCSTHTQQVEPLAAEN
ncbi:MAG: elongation factor P hydroxylase [Proteobacteria bacterium]|nr:elongation factor P hydroxylase [Pseudomonadota bacterium]